jgi:uncharacterized protein
MKILSVSDVELPLLYNPQIKKRFGEVGMIISCGDLPYYYLEYMISSLDRPLYHVLGNHASHVEYGTGGDRHAPWGGIDIHQRCVQTDQGLLLAGIEGSIRYNFGQHQYTQAEMWWMVWMLTPGLFLNRMLSGRYLDIFVTHAPAWKVHDMDDLPHQGVKAFNWLVKVFQPEYHLHGHIHVYRQDMVTETRINKTKVINTYGYKVIEIDERKFRSMPMIGQRG